MEQELTPEQKKAMSLVLGVIILVGAIILLMRSMFPYFLIASVVLLIVLILSAIVEFFFRDHDNLELWDYFSAYIGVLFIIAILGMFITYFIGYGIGGTSLGQACVQVYSSFDNAQQQLDDAINQLVEDSCKTLLVESCTLLRNTAKTAKSLQEVSDMADNLMKTTTIIDQATGTKK